MEEKEIDPRSKSIFITVILVFLTINCGFYSGQFAIAQTDQTKLQLQTASDALDHAFNSVLVAEKAGAEVSQLLAKLNTAGEFLSEAQNNYSSDNTVNVALILENVHQIADQVNADAVNLRNESLITSQNKVLFTLIFSIIGSIIFSILLFIIWRKLKHAHLTKQLRMKPKVIENTN